jgi:hypothetical protein
MKKVLTVIVLFFGLIAFNACTPQSAEDAGNEEIFNVDRGEIERPGDQGGNTGG